MLKTNRLRFLVSCMLALCLSGSAALRVGAQEIDPNDVIKVNTDLVVLDAQVVDKKSGKMFGGLQKQDFEIYEENVKQQIAYFSQDQLPLSVLLLLDTSRSLRPIIEQVGVGATNALRHLKPEDEVAVMAFAEYSKVLQPFTKDRSLIAAKVTEARSRLLTAIEMLLMTGPTSPKISLLAALRRIGFLSTPRNSTRLNAWKSFRE